MNASHVPDHLQGVNSSFAPSFKPLQSWDSDDIIALLVLGTASFLVLFRQAFWNKKEPGYELYFIAPQKKDGLEGLSPRRSGAVTTRNINDCMTQLNKDIIIFWGSQSGRSERLAKSLARECQTRFGLAAMAADLSSFDFDQLSVLAKEKTVGFVVATYGEGDPTDNATGLWDYLNDLKTQGSEGMLGGLSYFCFGLGNSKYLAYNRFVDLVDETLSSGGATRLSPVGKEDEAKISDQAWHIWKESTLQVLGQRYGKESRHGANEAPALAMKLVPRQGDLFSQNAATHLAETRVNGAAQSKMLQIAGIYELSKTSTHQGPGTPPRRCLHADLEVRALGAGASYQTGDHLALWPINPDQEVDLFSKLFNWDSKTINQIVDIEAEDEEGIDTGFPSPTTRDALLRYHLDICGPISLEIAGLIAAQCPSEAGRMRIKSLLQNPEQWAAVAEQHLTCANLMHLADEKSQWPQELFGQLLGLLPKLRPRYFSIASSPLVSPHVASITVGLVQTQRADDRPPFLGLTTSYLQTLQEEHLRRRVLSAGAPSVISPHTVDSPRFNTLGPRSVLSGGKLFGHIRTSPFRMPQDHSVPVIMIAAGSGIAPFRAFVQERQYMSAHGNNVGQMLLFYGCRSDDDYLYREVWEQGVASGFLEKQIVQSSMLRDGRKFYVQHSVIEHASAVARLLLQDGAYCCICGSAAMAGEVKIALSQCLEDKLSLQELKQSKRLQEDVWGA